MHESDKRIDERKWTLIYSLSEYEFIINIHTLPLHCCTWYSG